MSTTIVLVRCQMTTKLKFITADELLEMPRRDGIKYELIRGVLVPKMPTGRPHSEAVIRTGSLLIVYSDANEYGAAYAGEPGYRLERDPDTVRAPDVAWFAPGRRPEETQGFPELVPDLAVEVKSPSNSNPEMASKAVMWLSYGSQQVWVEDPERATVTIYRSGAPPPSANTIPLTAATCSQGSPLRCGGCFVGGGRPMR